MSAAKRMLEDREALWALAKQIAYDAKVIKDVDCGHGVYEDTGKDPKAACRRARRMIRKGEIALASFSERDLVDAIERVISEAADGCTHPACGD